MQFLGNSTSAVIPKTTNMIKHLAPSVLISNWSFFRDLLVTISHQCRCGSVVGTAAGNRCSKHTALLPQRATRTDVLAPADTEEHRTYYHWFPLEHRYSRTSRHWGTQKASSLVVLRTWTFYNQRTLRNTERIIMVFQKWKMGEFHSLTPIKHTNNTPENYPWI